VDSVRIVARWFVLMTALGTVGVVSVQPAGGESPDASSVDNPELAGGPNDTATYAETFGVSLPEAEARFAMMDVARILQEELRASEADGFGGLWIDHEPEFQVVVNVLAGHESEILPDVEKLGLSAVARIATARFTENELHHQQDAAATKMPMEADYATSVDIRNNRVEIWVETEQEVAIFEQADLGASVVVIQEDLPTPGIAIYGGLATSNGCTSNFSVEATSGTTEGVSGAGHCGHSTMEASS
jgi:hypothetical protein